MDPAPVEARPSAPMNPFAIVSLAAALVGWGVGGLGSLGLFFAFPPAALCTFLVFFIGCAVGAATGQAGRSQIRSGEGPEGGEGLATTGLVLGGIGLGVAVLMICLGVVGVVVLALLGPSLTNVYYNNHGDI